MVPTIDSHTHAWGPPSAEHPWVNESIVERVDRFTVDPVFTAEKLLAAMDRNRIDEAVLVGYPITEWTDNWYTLRAVENHDRLYGIVMADHFGSDAADHLRECLAVDGILGLRIAPGMDYEHMWRAGSGESDPTWLLDVIEETAFWTAARESDALVTISTGIDQLDQCRSLVDRYPDLTYLFDGYGPLAPDAPAEVFDAMAALASYETVGVKASHTPFVSNDGYPYRDVHELLVWLLETFGRERVVWGSDFPNVTAHSDSVTYAESFDWLHHVDALSSADRRWLEGRAFASHLGLG